MATNDHADKYLSTYKTFWWECIKYSFSSSLDRFLAIATVLGVAIIFASLYWGHEWDILAGLIPVAVFILSFIIHVTRYPHKLYKHKADKVREYETQAIDLEAHPRVERLQGIGDVWVARVGVRALGLKAIHGVFVYLTDIDGNQNELFDAPLHPSGQFRNATGATHVNPGNTQRFVEVLHWNMSSNEMGIPYHLTAQLREANVDLSKSRDRLVEAIALGSHDIALYATGEDIKPVAGQFRVEIVGGKLEMHKIENERQ